jgi:monovalent cation/hydrogen antiporter
MRGVETVRFLVVVATFARRLRVPASLLLVLTPEVVSLVVLPPLLFAAGEDLPWRDLRAVW